MFDIGANTKTIVRYPYINDANTFTSSIYDASTSMATITDGGYYYVSFSVSLEINFLQNRSQSGANIEVYVIDVEKKKKYLQHINVYPPYANDSITYNGSGLLRLNQGDKLQVQFLLGTFMQPNDSSVTGILNTTPKSGYFSVSKIY